MKGHGRNTHCKPVLINTSSTQSPPPLLRPHNEALSDTHVTFYHEVSGRDSSSHSVTRVTSYLVPDQSKSSHEQTCKHLDRYPACTSTQWCHHFAMFTWGQIDCGKMSRRDFSRDDGSSFFLSFGVCVCICYFVCRGSHENHLQNECRDTGKAPLRHGLEMAAHQDFCGTFRQLPGTILISLTRLPVL